jgi:hypothetical protein
MHLLYLFREKTHPVGSIEWDDILNVYRTGKRAKQMHKILHFFYNPEMSSERKLLCQENQRSSTKPVGL